MSAAMAAGPVLLVGAGRMGGALLKGWLARGYEPGRIFVQEPMLPADTAEIIAKAGTGEETIVVEVDTGRVDVARTHWPFLRDRRVDAYEGVTKRYLDE